MSESRNPRGAGRKPKYGVPTRKISLHMPAPLDQRLSREATRRGVPKLEIIIQALDAILPGDEMLPNTEGYALFD